MVRKIGAGVFPGFEPGRRYVIRFLNVDNRVSLLCDGRVLALFDYEKNAAVRPNPIFNSPYFGVQELETAFYSVAIDRDIHYTERGEYGCGRGYFIPEGRYFVLGDNSPQSGDSRNFEAIPKETIMGRPFMIFYPFSRVRFM